MVVEDDAGTVGGLIYGKIGGEFDADPIRLECNAKGFHKVIRLDLL